MLQDIYNWIVANYIELFAAISGFIYIFFSIRQSIFLWPIGIITSAGYIVVFYRTTLYADMALQGYYLIVSIYGWYHWLRGKDKSIGNETIKIITLSVRGVIYMFVSIALLTALLWYILGHTNASNPFWDSFITAGSIVATWMLARKYLEQWLLWIFFDAATIGLALYKKMYPTTILMAIYTVMAVVGYIRWRRDYLGIKSK